MSGVRVLVGTRKGAFILTSDGKREKWDVTGPLFGGWEIYHLKGSPVDPNRIYASQTSGWFGQIIQRSDDGGKTWHQPGTPPGEPTTTPEGMPKGESNKFVYDTSPETGKPLTTHQWYDGTQHPWEFKRVWHLEPSLTDPDTVYAGVEDAALFRSTDGGKTWHELAGLRGHGTGRKWPPGAGGMGLHTIMLDPTNPKRIFIAISAAGAFRTDDGGKTWKPINRGLKSQYIPDPNAEVGFCVHRIAHAPARGRTRCSCRCTGTCMRTDNAGDQWHEVSGNLPTDFGFPIDVHAHEPDTVYVVPINSDIAALSARGQARASTAAAPAATSGSRSRRACRRRTATSTSCATRWPSIRSTSAASTSAPPAARSTARPTAATTGRRSSAICRPCCRSRCRRCHDPRRLALSSADAGPRRRRR